MIRNTIRLTLLSSIACHALPAAAAPAAAKEDDPVQRAAAAEEEDQTVVVTGVRRSMTAGTKTETPITETPQPISVIPDEVYLAQGALSIADTLRYTPGVQTNAYGLDSRVDSAFIRGVTPVQYRDGMRELFGAYNSIVADPYNFSRVEVVRGPASVLFGQGSIGGLVNLVSKLPQFEAGGEIAIRYGSFGRKEALVDLTGPINDTLAARVVARARDADTQVDFVPDDRVFVAPSITWSPGARTSLTLLGLYQEDDGGSTAQFLPLDASVGRNEPGSLRPITPNPNGPLPFDTFVGEPGYDRYDGRVLQGTVLFEHGFGDTMTLRARARYIDSDVDYRGHYPNSYGNPFNPWLDPAQRVIGRINYVAVNESDVFTVDTNLVWRFNTGAAVEHVLLGGVDYLWNRVRQTTGSNAATTIDLFRPVYGNLVEPALRTGPAATQKQLGFYLQDQIRFFDRVSVVLGVRRDDVDNRTAGFAAQESEATTFRAGVIGELAAGVSPFFSYTESFLPVAGANATTGALYDPQRGEQYELGVKWQPDGRTLVTLTGYRIRNTGRLVADPTNPRVQIQEGEAKSEGVELEAIRTLPGDHQIIASYSYNEARVSRSSNAAQVGLQLDNVPKHNASLWAVKTIREARTGASLRLGAGVRYVGESFSYGVVQTSAAPLTYSIANIVRTPDATLVDALVAVNWREWELSLNAVNLTGERYYGACLARGDCFLGAERNVFATLAYRF